MSGHSKWASIKHKKAAADAQRGKVFTKVIKELTQAAREGGGDPNGNPRLRLALEKAREANMPKDNITQAVKRGTGELPGVTYESVTYEGYGSGGVAILVQVLTDNKNRAAAEIRNLFSKKNGNMGAPGSVAWMFHQKGLILVDKKVNEDELMTLALDNGAEDFKSDDPESYEITTTPGDFEKVKQSLVAKGIHPKYAEVTMIPANTVKVEGGAARQVLDLVQALEDHDDVQNVYANFDVPEDILNT
ncbi:MAG: YebC/PmpR family DNA-binding transcriptional regulator [Candidatus Omnitrophica bacterium]|nr:YebC/PmpR family DNA-binding transcriptional regulator [Candidatus Omnitrophota bacterium]